MKTHLMASQAVLASYWYGSLFPTATPKLSLRKKRRKSLIQGLFLYRRNTLWAQERTILFSKLEITALEPSAQFTGGFIFTRKMKEG